MISPSDYLTIANIIGGGNDDLVSATTQITSMLTTLQQINLDDETPRTSLNAVALQCSNTLANNQSPSQQLIAAIKALQNHVIKNAGSVNSFLSTNGIKVSSSFAVLSNFVGYPINNSNIAS